MRRYEVLDVFTSTPFAGNPLAVVRDGDDLSTETMQAIAREFGFSETAFLCAPTRPEADARLRIFTPISELPFAGHPTVGSAVVFARDADAARDDLTFETGAGLAPVRLLRAEGDVLGAEIGAPEPLSVGAVLSAAPVAAALALPEAAVRVARHPPTIASVGLPFLIVELSDRAALAAAAPSRDAMAAILPHDGADAAYLYATDLSAADRAAGPALDWSARMFAPEDAQDGAPWRGVVEDPATGSATAAAAALIVARVPGAGPRFAAAQGVDMGRPSRLDAQIARASDGAIWARVSGVCACVMSGALHV